MLVYIFNGLVFNALYRSDWTLNKLILGPMTYLVSIPKVSTTCRPYTFLDTDSQGGFALIIINMIPRTLTKYNNYAKLKNGFHSP